MEPTSSVAINNWSVDVYPKFCNFPDNGSVFLDKMRVQQNDVYNVSMEALANLDMLMSRVKRKLKRDFQECPSVQFGFGAQGVVAPHDQFMIQFHVLFNIVAQATFM